MSRDIRRNKRKTQGLKEFQVEVMLIDRIVARNDVEALVEYKRWINDNKIYHADIQVIKEIGEAW